MTMITFLLHRRSSLFIIVCLFLILLILIQKGRGGGLASAFGGGGGNTAFGSKTGDVLTWATSIVFGIFLLLAIVTEPVDRVNATRRDEAAPTAPAVAGSTPADADADDRAPNVPAQVPPTRRRSGDRRARSRRQ